MSPTALTPARFSVPLLMLTTRSSSARPASLCASMYETSARSLALSVAPVCAAGAIAAAAITKSVSVHLHIVEDSLSRRDFIVIDQVSHAWINAFGHVGAETREEIGRLVNSPFRHVPVDVAAAEKRRRAGERRPFRRCQRHIRPGGAFRPDGAAA